MVSHSRSNEMEAQKRNMERNVECQGSQWGTEPKVRLRELQIDCGKGLMFRQDALDGKRGCQWRVKASGGSVSGVRTPKRQDWTRGPHWCQCLRTISAL